MRFLVTSDWHLRSTVPSCVEATQEEWMDIQRKAVEAVVDIAVKSKVDCVLLGGDLYHTEQTASNEVIQISQDVPIELNEHGIKFYVLCGNHDLIGHSSELLYRSSIGIFLKSSYVNDMNDCPYCKGCNFDKEDYDGHKIIFKHTLTIPKEEIPYGVTCETPQSLLERYKDCVWVFTGDYHKNFHYEENGRHVVNSGCLTCQASDFEDYVTGVYVVDTELDTAAFWPVHIPQKFNHNGKEKKELDKEIEAFVEGIKKDDITLDYVSSLKKEALNHDKEIQSKINTWIEESGN